MNTKENIRQENKYLIDCLTGSDHLMRKEASDILTNYLRLKNREGGFMDAILPPDPITSDKLDLQHDTPDPVMIVDMEPESAGAHSVPLATGPKTVMIEAGRFPVFFKRVMSARYQQDVVRLLTWNMDIKGILKDFLLKDIQDRKDRGFMATVEGIVGAQNINTPNAEIEACQWTTQGTLDRTAIQQARKGLPSTNRRLNPSIGLVNNITLMDIPKLGRDEVGGDLAQDMFLSGEAPAKIGGITYVSTIKSDLVKDYDMYLFAEPKFTGGSWTLEDIILSTENINFFIEFFGYTMIAAAIKNIAAVCKVSFTDYQVDWRTGSSDPISNLPAGAEYP